MHAITPLCPHFWHVVSEGNTLLCFSPRWSHSWLFWLLSFLISYQALVLYISVKSWSFDVDKLWVNLRMQHGTHLRCVNLGGAAWMVVLLVLVTVTVEVPRSTRLWGAQVLCLLNLVLCHLFCVRNDWGTSRKRFREDIFSILWSSFSKSLHYQFLPFLCPFLEQNHCIRYIYIWKAFKFLKWISRVTLGMDNWCFICISV